MSDVLRQRLWELMRAADGEFQVADLCRQAHTPSDVGVKLADRLEREGWLERVPDTALLTYSFLKANDPGARLPEPPRRAESRRRYQNIWRTLRMNGWLTLTEVETLSTGGGVVPGKRLVAEYVNALVRAGMVRKQGRSPRSYRLVVDSGPKPPVFRKILEIYDPNTDRIMFRSREDAS